MPDMPSEGVYVQNAVAEEQASPFKKILGVNFIIFLIYYVIALLLIQKLGFLLFLYPIQALINSILGIVYIFKKDSIKSSAFFLAAFLLLLVGFGACFIGVAGFF
ncbi:hypothetical protein HYZ97_04490 [Candidatus Pacearchaeota archaeon]|nr:hypothetical protein [Candidatus Pacearchaeota archaeon]